MAVGRERTARAIAIRDHVLPLLQLHGAPQKLQAGESSLMLTFWQKSGLSFSVHTPFTPFPIEVAGRAGSYDEALLIQKGLAARPTLPWRLDIWHNGRKMMSLQWSHRDTAVEAISFRPGPWEAEVLALK